jgi:hypothetical protein
MIDLDQQRYKFEASWSILFFGKPPQPEEQGPFYKVKRWKSGLDIWFENSRAVKLTFKMVEQSIAKAKAERGSFIRRC